MLISIKDVPSYERHLLYCSELPRRRRADAGAKRRTVRRPRNIRRTPPTILQFPVVRPGDTAA